jgi:serine/threonine protein phosphatase PrpC
MACLSGILQVSAYKTTPQYSAKIFAPAPTINPSPIDSSAQKLWKEAEERLGKYETKQLLSAFAQCTSDKASRIICRDILSQYLVKGEIDFIPRSHFSLQDVAKGFKLAMQMYILKSAKKIPSFTKDVSADMASVMIKIAEARKKIVERNYEGTTDDLINALAGPVLNRVTLQKLHCEATLRPPQGKKGDRLTRWKTRSLNERAKSSKTIRTWLAKIDKIESTIIATPLVSTPVLTASTQGERPRQEDDEADGSFEVFGSPVSFYALFDGHGRPFIAQRLATNVSTLLQETLNLLEKPLQQATQSEIENVLSNVFVREQQEILRVRNKSLDNVGSTASVALIFVDEEGPAVWTVHVGDSRIIAINKDEAYQLTEDADPNAYEDSVRSRGGFVTDDRVNGYIAMARAVGDKCLHGAVSPRAKMSRFSLPRDTPTTLIIGCDGLFECNTSREIVEQYKKALSRHSEELAQELVWYAYISGSNDNISVKIVEIPKI